MKLVVLILILFAIAMFGVRRVFEPQVRRHFGIGLAVAFTMIIAFGSLVPNPLIFLFICLAGQMVMVGSTQEAVCRFLLLTVLIPNISYPVKIGSIYVLDIYVTHMLLIGLIITARFTKQSSPPKRGWTVEDTAMLVVTLAFLIDPVRQQGFTIALRGMLVVALSMFVPYYYLSRSFSDREQFAEFAAVIGGGAMILAVCGIYEAQHGWSLFEEIWFNVSTQLSMTRNLHIRASFLRAPATFIESTSFALFEMCGVIAIAATPRMFRRPGLWKGSIFVAIIGLLAAQSRGADLGLIVGFMAILMVRRKTGQVMALLVIAGVAVTLLSLASEANGQIASFLGSDQQFGEYKDYRSLLFERGLEEGRKHLLFGQTMPNVLDSLHDIAQGEHIVDLVNTYLTIFLLSGITGLVAVAYVMARVIMKLWRRPSSIARDPMADSVQAFSMAMLTGVMTALTFTSFIERNPVWLMVPLAGARILTRAPKVRPAPAPDEASARRGGIRRRSLAAAPG